MTENHPDPFMRPSVDKLVEKLRGLSALKGHPDAVLFVIRDLVHTFFVQEEKRPAHLWSLIDYNMYAFLGLMGGGIVHRNDKLMTEFSIREGVGTGGNPEAQLWAGGNPGEAPKIWHLRPGETSFGDRLQHGFKDASVENDGALIIWCACGTGFIPSAWKLHLQETGAGLFVGDSPPDEIVNPNLEMAPVLVLRKDENEKPEASGLFSRSTMMNVDDSSTKQGVQDVIKTHYIDMNPNGYISGCGCGRSYNSRVEWAKHVRVRIWRYLQNEFKGDENG